MDLYQIIKELQTEKRHLDGIIAALESRQAASGVKRRGRPPGSKNASTKRAKTAARRPRRRAAAATAETSEAEAGTES